MNDLVIHFSIVAFLLLAAGVLRAPQKRGRFVDYGRRRLERAAEARARGKCASSFEICTFASCLPRPFPPRNSWDVGC